MAKKSKNKKKPSYNLGFWQLFGVVLLAIVLGGVICNFAYNNILQDEINSSVYSPPLNSAKTVNNFPAKKPIEK